MKPSLKLSDEQKRLLDETYKRFQRAGANLDQEAMIRLTEINSFFLLYQCNLIKMCSRKLMVIV